MNLKKRLEKAKYAVEDSNNMFTLPAIFILSINFVIGILGVGLETLPIALSLMTVLSFFGLLWGLFVSVIKSDCRSKVEFYEEIIEEVENEKKTTN